VVTGATRPHPGGPSPYEHRRLTIDAEGLIVGRPRHADLRRREHHPQIEEFSVSLPAIAEVQVPDNRYGEETSLGCRPVPPCRIPNRDFCRGQIAHFRVLRHVWFLPCR
jgi:hypothetical protein